jgi:hypothetical protein
VRAYTVAATAVALGVPPKWVDNVLSHHQVPGVLQERQGIARRVTPEAVLVLDIALKLVDSLALPLPDALKTAQRLVAARESGIELPGVTSIHLRADVKNLTDDLIIRLERAVEITPTPRRGRPRRK